MKHLNKLIMVLFAIGVTACGTNQNPNNSMLTGTGYYNQNGQWVSTVGGNTCLTTLNQGLSLNFSATGIDVVSGRFFAGNVPQYWTAAGAHGAVTLSGGYQQGYGAISLQKSSYDGSSINMTLNPQQRTASGQIQISTSAVMNSGLLNSVMYGQQYGNQYGGQYNQGANICVTGIALDVTYSSGYSYGNQMTTGQIYKAMVFLYLSNGQVAQSPVAIQ